MVQPAAGKVSHHVILDRRRLTGLRPSISSSRIAATGLSSPRSLRQYLLAVRLLSPTISHTHGVIRQGAHGSGHRRRNGEAPSNAGAVPDKCNIIEKAATRCVLACVLDAFLRHVAS